MKYLPLILTTIFTPAILSAKDYTATVKGEDGTPLAFVHAVCPRTDNYAMTDDRGVLWFSDEVFADTDTLVFESMFYENLHISVETLKTGNDVVLRAKTQDLSTIEFYSPASLNKMVTEMAKYFSKNYASDYAAKITILRTVECNGKYREFNGYQGLFSSFNFTQSPPRLPWDDNNRVKYAPLSIMRSDPLAAGSDNLLEVRSVFLPESSSPLKTNYFDHQHITVPTALRALEFYSPLNPKQIKNFSYSVDSSYTNNGQQIVVIRFQTIPEKFWSGTRIFGTGQIHYNCGTHMPEKIVMENHQDQFTNFIRWKTATLLPSATQHRIEVNYSTQNGEIYPRNYSLRINWVNPGDKYIDKDYIYYIKNQSRRDPIGNKLREYEYVSLSDVVLLKGGQKMDVQENMKGTFDHGEIYYYYAPFVQAKWDATPMPGIDRAKLLRDLNANGKTLYEQAAVNSTDGTFYNYSPEFTQKADYYYKHARTTLHTLIYGKSYE